MHKFICVFVLGRPGAGKDTQAEILAKTLSLHQIRTSKILMQEFAEHPDSPTSKEEKELFDEGKLMTPSFVNDVVRKHINELMSHNLHGKKGIIFSGTPRTLFEAEHIGNFCVEKFGRQHTIAIYVDVGEDECTQRILKRNARPLDRDREVIAERMEEFDDRTQPVINFYKQREMLLQVDGSKDIETIATDIYEKLKQRLKP